MQITCRVKILFFRKKGNYIKYGLGTCNAIKNLIANFENMTCIPREKILDFRTRDATKNEFIDLLVYHINCNVGNFGLEMRNVRDENEFC